MLKFCCLPANMNIWIVALIVFFFNLPFGYWRASVRRFSRQWILSIHAPVPFVIALRIWSGLGWRWITFPVVIGAFFGGQFIGGQVYLWRHRRDRSGQIKEKVSQGPLNGATADHRNLTRSSDEEV